MPLTVPPGSINRYLARIYNDWVFIYGLPDPYGPLIQHPFIMYVFWHEIKFRKQFMFFDSNPRTNEVIQIHAYVFILQCVCDSDIPCPFQTLLPYPTPSAQ